MQEHAKVSEYLLELLRCGLHETVPEEKPQDISWAAVYAMAKRHSVLALAYSAVKRLPETAMDAEEAEQWERSVELLKAKFVVQEYELSHLYELLQGKQIAYMPLKGSVIRDLYPEPSLREMGDLDILVPRERAMEICELLCAEGYERIPTENHHIELKRPPLTIVELHTDMMSKTNAFYHYYREPWLRAIAKGTSETYEHMMSVEDTYIFLIVHSAKHYYYSGTGIRSVIDIYLYNRAYATVMDRFYIKNELDKLGLVDYEDQIRDMGKIWFEKADLLVTDEIAQMQYEILSGSTYGDRKGQDRNIVRNYMRAGKSKRSSKLTMFFRFVFLPRVEMQEIMYPVLKKWPVLLPFCWIHRWARILFTKPKSIVLNYQRVTQIDFKEERD